MKLRGSRVGVTGATGFLGSHIVAALRHAGAVPVAVVRRPPDDATLEHRHADLEDGSSLAKAFAGLDAVVSCAAMYTLGRATWDSFYRANVVGTENVYEALQDAGVSRAIQISTWGVYRFAMQKARWRRGSLARVLDEDADQVDGEKREGGGYRATKQISEQRAWSLSSANKIELTVLRPGGIYGARDRMLLPKLRALARFPLSPAPSLIAPLVYVGDVASAVVVALERKQSVGRAYNLGGPDVGFHQFMRALHRADPRARGVAVPLPLPVTLTLDNSRAARDLAFSNRDFDSGLLATFLEED